MLSTKMSHDLIALINSWSSFEKVRSWVISLVELCTPDHLYLCDGSDFQKQELCQQLEEQGVFVKLNPSLFPDSYWCASDPSDVARVEDATYICSDKKEDAGPTNHWCDPNEMIVTLQKLFSGCMKGRTMYVIPFCMGPVHSPLSRFGLEITDSAYVVVNMMIMARVGVHVLRKIEESQDFIPCVHSVGVPLKQGEKSSLWPCRKDEKYIVHFPQKKEIWSFGSGYGGNALLGKKCFALRIASVLGKEQGWLAEHMLILGITNPQGKKIYIAAAFPSSCGKTNLAMLKPSLPGWKIECVGDDIAWMKMGIDGQLYAINPEYGFFGVAPGTSWKSNPNAMAALSQSSIFTNVGLTQERGVWWEGMTEEIPEGVLTWKKEVREASSRDEVAHPNARFTAPASQCPVIDPMWESAQGVPISAILFGGRRDDTIPLVFESLSWDHGVFLGCCVSSQTTAAASGKVGVLRHDPFAMLPFCGYHMGDYFQHWLDVGKELKKPPKIFCVNWFQKDKEGRFIWPGFGDNIRVLDWIFRRCTSEEKAETSPIGYLPLKESFNLRGLSRNENYFEQLFHFDKLKWKDELKEIENYLNLFQPKLPFKIKEEWEQLKNRINVF